MSSSVRFCWVKVKVKSKAYDSCLCRTDRKPFEKFRARAAFARRIQCKAAGQDKMKGQLLCTKINVAAQKFLQQNYWRRSPYEEEGGEGQCRRTAR